MRYSFTALDTFDKCPRQFFELYKAKSVRKESGPEAEEGIRVHQAMESAFLDGTPLPDDYAAWQTYINAVARSADEIHAEKRLMLGDDMRPTEGEALLVGEIDVLLIKGPQAVVLDWKTGKVRDNTLQLSIYGLLVLRHYPEVETVTATNVYLKFGKLGEPHVYTRGQVASLSATIGIKIFRIEQAEKRNEWPEKPSALCPWCPVKLCKYWKPG